MLTFQLNKKATISITLVATLLLLFPWIVFGQLDIDDPIQTFFWKFVNLVFGWFVWVGGTLLDHAITSYVVGFGDQFRDTGLGFAVHELWTMVRDFFNLFFIFGLVYIGFKMILNSGDSKARHMLAGIVMAGLLVNFSLFFTKFIVDFSNVMATQLAGAFTTTSGDYEAAASFANVLGITSLFGFGGPEGLDAVQKGGGFAYIFGTMVLYLILGFVLAAGGLLLMIRFVVLNIYMILSPVMFLGWVFPGMADLSQTYWKGFLKRAFFAPAYLMMLYFAYFVTHQFTVSTSRESFAELFVNADSAAKSFDTTIPFFIIICGFLVAAILVAQKMGAEGANLSVSLGKKMAGQAGRAAGSMTLGVAAAGSRQVVGGTAHLISQNKSFQEWTAKDRTGITRQAMNLTRGVANSSFDARQGLGMTGVLGKGKTGGYTTRVKEQEKADTELKQFFNKTNIKDKNGKLTKEAQKKVDEALKKDKSYADAEKKKTATKEANKKLKDKETKLNDAKKPKLKELNDLETKLKATDEKNVVEINRIEKEMQTTKLEIESIENSFGAENLAKDIAAGATAEKVATAEATRIHDQITKQTEADLIYGNQIAFQQRLDSSGEFWQHKAVQVASAGAAGAAAAVLTGGLSLPVTGAIALAAAGAGAATSKTYGMQNQQVAAAMARKTGGTGLEIEKKDKESKQIALLSKQIKDNDAADNKNEPPAPSQETADKAA